VRGRFIAVVGHGPLLEREEGAAATLRQLGSDVRVLDLWEDPGRLFLDGEVDGEQRVRALVVEALDRPDLASAALRALRREPRLGRVPALLAIGEPQVARVDPAAGFDDFVLAPFVPSELYARIRQLEWRRSEFSNEERLKIGTLVIDRQARDVFVDGRSVELTAKEFSLLVCLCENRGRVKTREQLLARVWSSSYEGGARTVDIHVRRLRAKLGAAFPLQTVRGAGYKLPAHVEPRGGEPPA
jgi:DNA-binding response OmpR family regulator